MPPLHRSLVLWLGLLFVAFLLCLAHDSLTTKRQVVIGISSASRLEIASSGALFHVLHYYKDYATPAGPAETRYREMPFKTEYPTWFPTPWIGRRVDMMYITDARGDCHGYGTVVRGASLPLGLLAALFVPPWILFAIRRAKRIARAREAVMAAAGGFKNTA